MFSRLFINLIQPDIELKAAVGCWASSPFISKRLMRFLRARPNGRLAGWDYWSCGAADRPSSQTSLFHADWLKHAAVCSVCNATCCVPYLITGMLVERCTECKLSDSITREKHSVSVIEGLKQRSSKTFNTSQVASDQFRLVCCVSQHTAALKGLIISLAAQ